MQEFSGSCKFKSSIKSTAEMTTCSTTQFYDKTQRSSIQKSAVGEKVANQINDVIEAVSQNKLSKWEVLKAFQETNNFTLDKIRRWQSPSFIICGQSTARPNRPRNPNCIKSIDCMHRHTLSEGQAEEHYYLIQKWKLLASQNQILKKQILSMPRNNVTLRNAV